MVLTNMPFAVKAEVDNNNNVETTLDNEKIVIANDYIKREFSINNGKVLTTLIENNRAKTQIVPKEGSEDFIINTIKTESSDSESTQPIVPKNVIERTNWKAALSVSTGTKYSDVDVLKYFSNIF